MGVYNPMAKMPNNCAVCREECRYRNITAHKRHKRCPLIEVKAPHGRLIDADELWEHVGRDRLDSRELIMKMVDKAPTVIEAEVN